jgi:hypothetical protein
MNRKYNSEGVIHKSQEVKREEVVEETRSTHQAERRQLSKVITYGMPENCSVDLLLMILLNVILSTN